MKNLAIGAHPDDIEIFMFGLLSIYKDMNNQIFTLNIRVSIKYKINPRRRVKIAY